MVLYINGDSIVMGIVLLVLLIYTIYGFTVSKKKSPFYDYFREYHNGEVHQGYEINGLGLYVILATVLVFFVLLHTLF